MTDPRVLKVTQGFNGWTPKLSVVSDGTRRVLKLSGWTGGQGNPPQYNLFLGLTGYVTDIADAVNIAGDATLVQYQEDGVNVGAPDVDTINFTGDVDVSYLSGTLTINSKLADVITAGTYGSSTQYAIPTFNAKGLCTGVTLQTVNTTLTEANFAVAKTGQPTYTVSWVLTALTDARTWTIPNTNLDFGNIAKIPAVATPYTTGAMAGTRPQCLGGSSNTFSGGTDVVAIGCTSSTLSGTNVTYINVTGLADSAITWANAIVLGSSYSTLPGAIGGGLNVLTNTTTINNHGAGTYSAVSAAGAVSSSNCVKLALGVVSSAVHEIDFIIQHNNNYHNVGTITGKRRVIAFSDYTGAITVSSENTPYADFVMGSSTGLAFSVTLDTTNNRLIPTLTATGIGTIFGVAMQAKVTSYYTIKSA